MSTNQSNPSQNAGLVRDFLRTKNIDVGQCDALEIVARAQGFPNLHAMQRAEVSPSPSRDATATESVRLYDPKDGESYSLRRDADVRLTFKGRLLAESSDKNQDQRLTYYVYRTKRGT